MKFNIIGTLAAVMATAVLLSSCTNEEPVGSSDERVAARITAGFKTATRAHDDQWDEDDAIGLAMLLHDGTEIVNNVYNFHYISATQGRFEPSNPGMTIYLPQDGSDVVFRSYYPYYPSLDRDMMIPLSVENQTILPQVDFMSADHPSAYNKANPVVHLTFHHRLTKLIFLFEGDQDNDITDFSQVQVTVNGMMTEATYDLKNERLYPDGSTFAPITMENSEQEAQRYGIVLPRVAGDGVSFDFTLPDGSIFSADLDPTQELESGYEYTFRVNLRKTPLQLSAEIAPWIDGPETRYQAVQVNTPAGNSSGVTEGNVMNVYLEQADDSFSLLGSFTYGSNGRWSSPTPIYWENITQNPAVMRSSIIAAPALNTTQLPDILISDEISVPRNSGANFRLHHADSKVTVRLTSSEFTDTELAGATVMLPNYLTGGREENGTFVPGTNVSNINLEKTAPTIFVGLFQPQTIESGNPVISVTLNGRVYNAPAEASGDFAFLENTAYVIDLNVSKAGLGVSATVVDWEEDDLLFDAVTVGAKLDGATGVLDGERMIVYTGNSATRQELSTFTYDLGGNTWSALPVVYWESLSSPTTFYASILRAPYYNNTQLPDYLVAEPRTIYASNGVDFTLKHAASQVVVQLRSDGSFDDDELAAMDITLPDYLIGGDVVDGVFIPGTATGDITVEKNLGDNGDSAIALIQPQTRPANEVLVSLYNPDNDRTYTVSPDQDVVFRQNVTTTITITVTKTAVSLSVTVVDWEQGQTISLTATSVDVTGQLDNSDNFFRNQTIYIYDLNTPIETYTYSFLQNDNGYSWAGIPIYWDDQQGNPLPLAAVYYPVGSPTPSISGSTTTFPWSVSTNQTNGIDEYDLLMDYQSLTTPQRVNFQFDHVLTMVQVNLINGEGFTDAELAEAAVAINNVYVNGIASLTGVSVSQTGSKATVIPQKVEDERYRALLIPQTLGNTDTTITVTLPGYSSPFTGTLENPLVMEAGTINVINVTLTKTRIVLSATVKAWEPGETGTIGIQ